MNTRLIAFPSALCIFGIFFLASSTNAQTIILDFEGLPAAGYVATSYIDPAARLSNLYRDTVGVSFSSGTGYVGVVQLGANHATSGVNGISGSNPNNTVTYGNDYPITAALFRPQESYPSSGHKLRVCTRRSGRLECANSNTVCL